MGDQENNEAGTAGDNAVSTETAPPAPAPEVAASEAKSIGIKELAKGKSDLYKLFVSDLHIREGWNVRENDFNSEDPDDLALAQSIAAVGVKAPLTGVVDDGKFYVTDGHRRRAAALYAIARLDAPKDMKVSVQTEGRGADERDQVLSMITRNSGKALTALEMGKVCARLIAFGMTEVEIGAKIGRTRQQITNWLDLNSAPGEVKEMVAAGEVSASVAAKEVRANKGDKKKATEVLKESVKAAKAKGKKKATPKDVENVKKRGRPPKAKAEEAASASAVPGTIPQGEGEPPIVPQPPIKDRTPAAVADKAVLKAILVNAEKTEQGYNLNVDFTAQEFSALKRCCN